MNMAFAGFPRAIFFIIGVCLMQIPSSTVVDNGFVSAQQMYSQDYSVDCNNHHTGSTGYLCNGAAQECETFVLYRAQPLYMSLLNISLLFNMSPAVIASASNLSVTNYSKPLAKDQPVLIPIHCNCWGDFSQANVTYTVQHNDIFMNIANKTFEGLTTCQAILAQNPSHSQYDLIPGLELVAPLRCACPTDTQVSRGVKYLLSYIVEPGDDEEIITSKLNILPADFISANELVPINPTIYPRTTLLIPLNHTPVVPPPGPLTPSPNDDIHCFNCSHGTANGKRLSTKLTAGILSAVCAVFGIVVVSCILVRRGICCRTAGEKQDAIHSRPPKTKRPLNEGYSMTMVLDGTVSRAFTLEEMRVATQNFSRKIGHGGFGSVFFGKLPEGNEIAVKVLSLLSKQGIHQFQNEVNLLSRVHHKKLVSLLGYCNDSTELMLIYEYMSGGSLRDCLYGPQGGFSVLDWKARLKVALDSAQGLEYLHMGCTPKIIHRDVKTANILLDRNMNGKLADFGLSRMTNEDGASHVTTMVKGTIGYLDPDYFRTQMLTEKSDVYSFGVVLLEIICGRRPINSSLDEEELNLIQWVKPYVEKDENPSEIAVIIDKKLGGNYDTKSVTGIAKLALRCVEARPSSRPSVSEVVAEIKEAITHEIDGHHPNSEGFAIENGDLQVFPVRSRVDSSEPKDMQWGDNSSNLPHIGR